MIKQLVVRALVIRWPIPVLIVVTLGLGLVFTVIVSALGPIDSSMSADLSTECATSAGPGSMPSASPTFGPPPGRSAGNSDTGFSPQQRECMDALCVQRIAIVLADQQTQAVGVAAEPAAVIAAIFRRAALTRAAGCPAPSTRETIDIVSATAGPSTPAISATAGRGPSTDTSATNCQTGSAATTSLPETLVAQSMCGQRVNPAAISIADLVYWEYLEQAPRRVGIAMGEGMMLTDDPATARLTLTALPQDSEVRVNRILGSDW
ncbi:hypothetical protein [Nocardia yamanashiensis]|uniref:hypothetical protein n=1 Tax=Nocardia yamanashiensis TaxID=209247 RepID=UPI000833CAE4|nr:hypothetical protein [Nocardia yamanashiensis]